MTAPSVTDFGECPQGRGGQMSIVPSLAQARELRCTAVRHDPVYNSAHMGAVCKQ